MGPEAWVAISALGASALTGAITWGIEVYRGRHRQRIDEDAALRKAAVDLVRSALVLALRSGILQQQVVHRSGIGEGLDIALRVRKPIEVTDIYLWLEHCYEPILQAQASIWLLSDSQPLIEATGDLVIAATDVTEKSVSTILQPKPGIEGWVKGLYRAQIDPSADKERQAAVEDLGRRCRMFATLVREELHVAIPSALLDAFPIDPEHLARLRAKDAETPSAR